MAENPVALDCELCVEVLAGVAVTGGSATGPTSPFFSRLVHRTSVVDVIAGLGALAPGYLLVLPRQHVESVGELDLQDLAHAYRVARELAVIVRRRFGCRVALVEHGSSGLAGSSKACIAHAHIHLFPYPPGREGAEFVAPGSEAVEGLDALRSAAVRGQNYYYCSLAGQEGRILVNPELPSQFARQRWASMLDVADKWDWLIYPQLETVTSTMDVLRRDLTHEGSQLHETLLGYSAMASDYVRRTSVFPKNSVLKDEIARLSDLAEGSILDAGAGGGRDSLLFAKLGRDVIALDACPDFVAALPKNDRIRPMLGDIRALPLEAESVGGVWCSAVLLHLDQSDVEVAFEEFFRVLRPGGVMYASVKEGSGRDTREAYGASERLLHFFFYRAETLTEIAMDVGFEVLETWTGDEPDSSGEVTSWVKVLLRKAAE
ncbi:methyltransferase domain-containing protein [Streptosporangium sp. CA-115845]|uniref:methyltransferase domain-containing protein n=1 Tax=Streptosporangium sp. CA-115845 TaxID=3240071 RepID=UPI003D902F4E